MFESVFTDALSLQLANIVKACRHNIKQVKTVHIVRGSVATQARRASLEEKASVVSAFSQNLKKTVCLLAVVASVTANAQTVHIFSSTDSEGITSWATQALDKTYIRVASLSTQAIEDTHLPATQTQPICGGCGGQAVAKRRQAWQASVDSTALRYGIDPRWVLALIEVESGFNPNAVSSKGAIGLMQLMPATAAKYGMRNNRELLEPSRNLDIGVRHLKDLLALHGGNMVLAMASYNAGSGAIAKHGNRIPRFNETMLYVPAVLAAASRIPITNNP